MADTVSVESDGSTMNIYDSQPDGAARGAVIVVQEAFGVNDHIQDVCRRFSAAGYRAVAPHLFHRTGDPVIAYDAMQDVMPHIMGLSADGLASDLDATVAYVKGLGFSEAQTGIVGFCMGGSVSFLAASRTPLGAAASFYGGGLAEGRFGMPALIDIAPDLKAPWLGLFGDQDQSIPVDQVETLRETVKKAAVPAEVVRYPEADHGFHCDARDSYHEASAKDAWRRTLEWFDAHLAS